jgi:hypothetical protein
MLYTLLQLTASWVFRSVITSCAIKGPCIPRCTAAILAAIHRPSHVGYWGRSRRKGLVTLVFYRCMHILHILLFFMCSLNVDMTRSTKDAAFAFEILQENLPVKILSNWRFCEQKTLDNTVKLRCFVSKSNWFSSKLFFFLYEGESDQLQFWTRSPHYRQKIISLFHGV